MNRLSPLKAVFWAMAGLLLLVGGLRAASADAPTLFNFTAPNGLSPKAALIQGSDGNFYGTTELGGSGFYGTAFKLTTDGTPVQQREWQQSPIRADPGQRRQLLWHGRERQRR